MRKTFRIAHPGHSRWLTDRSASRKDKRVRKNLIEVISEARYARKAVDPKITNKFASAEAVDRMNWTLPELREIARREIRKTRKMLATKTGRRR